MISFDSVSKRYPEGREALIDVSFGVAAGEMVFVTGHSGAGKTTLLKMIAAIERPSRGSLAVHGRNLARLQPREIPR
ncbi:MAG TPA: ATP-binding cassette domain-containing protein, partial [Rhodanobacteraceae bacterium]|nr:ATP-binding cassette domain-containing protein [Rhodanobacteraceae bacterium]